MHDIVLFLVDFVHAHSQYTHIVIFLLALSEAIPVVGTVVPGSTLIIGIIPGTFGLIDHLMGETLQRGTRGRDLRRPRPE
jgi:hypothetical protein